MSKKDTFEIGLVMAGAISAGAYTSGVVDYLLEALRHYEKIRKKFAQEHPGESLHNVQIRVISGASAGGMTGTMLLSAMMDRDYRPMSGYNPSTVSRPDIDTNIFYRSWVDAKEGIDIRYLLNDSDITGNSPLKSLLNCERLDYIANSALSRPRELQADDYIPERIDHFLSVFNLGGVPYTLGFEGSSSQYGVVNHSDMMHFVHDSRADVVFGANEIPLCGDNGCSLNENWKLLRQSTLATGAFPIALEPRELSKERASYDEWEWWVPQGNKPEGNGNSGICTEKGRCFAITNIPPDWSYQQRAEYAFVCVDGGVANNEPLEIARRALAGDELFNPRGADEAHRAVIMVDPFPSEPIKVCTAEGMNLFTIAARLFAGLKEQSRFKPDELEMARNPKIFSRFMIAPSREGAMRGEELASGSLGAFGGFLSEKFRQHDFQLGRKNCQSFLTNHFIVGTANPLVQQHLEWFRNNGCVVQKEGKEYIQIVPMVKLPDHDITKPIPLIDFATIAMSKNEVNEIMELIEKRIKTVVKKSVFVTMLINGITKEMDIGVLKWIANKMLQLLRGAICSFIVSKSSKKIRGIMESDLQKRKLLV